MPVLNPQTKEMDHVDLNIVHRILLGSCKVESLAEASDEELDLTFQLKYENEELSLNLSEQENKYHHKKILSPDKFEQMLADAVYHAPRKLEEVVEFKEILDSMIEEFISAHPEKYYHGFGKTYEYGTGIGIIMDSKANQEVGTFEDIQFYPHLKDRSTLQINNILLATLMIEDVQKDLSRYWFHFYDLGSNTIINFQLNKMGIEDPSEIGFDNAKSKGFVMTMKALQAHDTKTPLIQQAQHTKSLIEGLNKQDPLYQQNFDQFKEARLQLLQESQKQAKKDSLVNKFADLDFEF